MSIMATFKVDRSGLASPVPEPTNDGRCKTCRWWSIGGFDRWGTCLLTCTTSAEPIYPETLAVSYAKDEFGDTTTHPSELVTAPDFGCVQYEAKGD